MNRNFWDVDNNGKFDVVDIFWIVLQLVAYGSGVILMASTFARSFHLLSSDAFLPSGTGMDWWPWLTAASPEVGLVISWLSGEVGFRKGKIQLVVLSVVGFALFASIIGTMQLYDVALVEGSDMAVAASVSHFIASVLPLFTIAFSGLATMILSAMSRMEKVSQPASRVTITQPPQQRPREQEYRLPQPVEREYLGEPVSDPTRRKGGELPKGTYLTGEKHREAQAVARQQLERIKQSSNGHQSE